MNFWKFSLYTVLGCLPWTFALAWLGYELGARWETVDRIMRPISLGLAVVFGILLVWFVVRRIRQIRSETAALADQEDGTSRTIVHEPSTSATSSNPSDR
jgi:membrane protein DedA with SNARE-associated domain